MTEHPGKGFRWVKVARRIRDLILADVTDRRGWKQEWEYHFAPETRGEIKRAWLRIIKRELTRRTAQPRPRAKQQ